MAILDLELKLAGGDVEDLDLPGLGWRSAARGQELSVSREGKADNSFSEAIQFQAQRSLAWVPEQNFLKTTARQGLVIRANGQCFHQRQMCGLQRLLVGTGQFRRNQAS